MKFGRRSSSASPITGSWIEMKASVVIISIFTFILSLPLWLGHTFLPTDLIKWTAPWNDNAQFVDAQNHFYTDPIGEHYPWKVLLAEMIEKREFPLWNPYNLYGVPYLASSTPQAFDPTNVLFGIGDSRLAYDLSILLKIWLSGLTMLLLLRHYRISRLSATVAAISYMLNGAYIGNYHAGWMTGAWTWVPLTVLYLEKSRDENPWRNLLLAGIFLGLAHLGGNIQISLQVFLLLGLWGLASVVYDKSKKQKQLQRWLPLATVFGAAIVSLAIAAVQLVPTAEMLAHVAPRRDHSWMGWLQDWPKHLVRLPFIIALAIPNFIGHHSIFSPVLATGAKWSDFVYGYAGLAPLVFAIIAAFFRNDANARRWRFVAVGALFTVFLTPLVVVLYFRALIVWCFAIAVLAGLGLDYLASRTTQVMLLLQRLQRMLTAAAVFFILAVATLSAFIAWKGRDYLPIARQYVESRVRSNNPAFGFNAEFYLRKVEATFDYYQLSNFALWVPIGLMMVLAVSIYWYRRRVLGVGAFKALALILVALDLSFFAASYVPVVSLEKFPHYPATPAIKFLQADSSLFRFMPAAQEGIDPPVFHFESNILPGLQSTSGCGSLNCFRTVKFIESFEESDPGPDPIKYPQVAALSNSKYLLTKSKSLPEPPYRLVYSGEINVYENLETMPRAYLVDRFHVMSAEEILRAIKENRLDYKHEVLLEERPEFSSQALPEAGPVGEAWMERYSPNRVVVKTRANRETLLVLSDTNYPGWRATINGEDTKILRANYLFRAVAVPAGKSVVEFRYFPVSFQVGLAISFLAFLVCLGVLLVETMRRGKARRRFVEAMKNTTVTVSPPLDL
jgi:hypothetical protein